MYTQNIPWIEPANRVKECQVKVPRIDYEDKAILKVGPHGGKKSGWMFHPYLGKIPPKN